ncbi:ABC transporter substrate-binding protein [uncultured Corynebacterium sp.]|uniref:ABC transporter substrate-binding protein n=1 Tax=uncultured Corynebacterium sp. TaxID=159447 RepID=UPI0025E8FE55|nr:ABC transporter substrate-binding protein [uncultured Corynebacterium sp.]
MNLVATPEISAESAKDNVVNDELPDSVEKFEFNTTQPAPEAVANLAPDMLLTVAAWFDYYDSGMQDKLEAIAPVLQISGAPDKDADWLQPLVEQAELIGKKAETEQSIADYNSTIDRLAQTVNGAGQTVAAGKAPALSYYHRSGLTIAGANFAEYVAEQLG